MILSYNVSSLKSFDHLWEVYGKLITPHPDPMRTMWGPQRDSSRPEMVSTKPKIIALRSPTTKHSPDFGVFTVEAEAYPILLVGCRGHHYNSGTRDVKQAHVERFLGSHPSCTFAGECNMSSVAQVDAVFWQAVQITRALRLLPQTLLVKEEHTENDPPEKIGRNMGKISTRTKLRERLGRFLRLSSES